MIDIKKLIKEAHENAVNHGFWEEFNDMEEAKKILPDRSILWHEKMAIGNMLMLISDEVSEAHEALRNNDKENFAEELADVAIRLADLCGGLDMDLEAEIQKKMEKNKDRPYKHGKQF